LKELTSQPIAQGRTAEIFLWDEGHILKLYREWCPPHWIKEEAQIAQAVHDAGIPSPAAGEILEINGRQGLIYERIRGISMLQDMNARPWTILKHARSLAELQVKINKQSITGLPRYKEGLRYAIGKTPYLTEDLRSKTLALLDTLPDGQQLCHGDYHPGNVILTKDGPIVIDWMTASAGSPWMDVARTSLLLSIGPRGAGKLVNPVVGIAIKLYHRAYLSRYHALAPDPKNESNRWAPVIAAARLNEDIVPEREALLKVIKEGQTNESF
jgi:uncharacterized protein (TIGR02172 family)